MNDTSELPGQIITFYSYKGGTGRSMAVANLACLLGRELAKTSKRVLVMDWDLEAPGLHRYFSARCDLPQFREQAGVADYFYRLLDIIEKSPELFRTLISPDGCAVLEKTLPLGDYIIPDVVPGVDFMRAGLFNEDYARLVNSFNWMEFYTNYGAIIRTFREMLAENYAYVLIDSRTGITDVSGICTTLLPEKLVGVFVPNQQSLEGLAEIVKKAIDYRSRADDFRPLAVFPLPSRIENAEKELKDRWREKYQREFEALLQKEYQIDKCDLSNYFSEVLLPHTSYYAYGENIAVFDDRLQDAVSLSRAYERFFDRLIHYDAPWELPDSEPRTTAPVTSAAAAAVPTITPEPVYDAFLCYASAERAAVIKVEARLAELEVKTFLDDRDLEPGQEWALAMDRAMAKSRTVLIFFGPSGAFPWADQRALSTLEALAKRGNKLIIPVVLPDASLESQRLPPFLKNIHAVTLSSLRDRASIDRIAASIHATRGADAAASYNRVPTGSRTSASDLLQPMESSAKLGNDGAARTRLRRWKVFGAIGVLTLMGVAIFSYLHRQRPKDASVSGLIEMAYENREKNNLADAIAELTRGLTLNPDPAQAARLYSDRAYCYQRTGDWAKSISDLTSALATQPPPELRLQLFRDLAYAYFSAGEPESALMDFDAIVKLDTAALQANPAKPERLRLLEDRGIAYVRLCKPDEALADFKEAQELDLNNAFIQSTVVSIRGTLTPSGASHFFVFMWPYHGGADIPKVVLGLAPNTVKWINGRAWAAPFIPQTEVRYKNANDRQLAQKIVAELGRRGFQVQGPVPTDSASTPRIELWIANHVSQ